MGSKPIKKRVGETTLKSLFEGILSADPLDFIIWAQWYVKRNFTCKECIETRVMSSGNPPRCDSCGLPTAKLLNKHFKKETK